MTNLPVSPVIELKIPDEEYAREGFEGSAPWDFTTSDGGDGSWARATDQFWYGSASLKSPTLSNGQFSDFNMVAPAGTTKCRLWYRTDIAAADRLELITLQNVVFHLSVQTGTVEWTQIELPITGGQTLIARYVRNAGGGANACWIDDVQFLGDTWVDITEDCRLEDAHSGGGVRIKRGRPNESPIAEPTECDLVINNAAGIYSELNPSSPYYGRLGRNQPLRVAASRVSDSFDRTVSNSWGSTPDWVDTENVTRAGHAWNVIGVAANFDVTAGEGLIQAQTGYQIAHFGTYADVDIVVRLKISSRTGRFGVILRTNSTGLDRIAAVIVPGGTDSIKIVRIVGGTGWEFSANLSSNLVVDQWYWLRGQITGRRYRCRVWSDGDSEPTTWNRTYVDDRGPSDGDLPTTGGVGVIVQDGSALVSFGALQVNLWRAHTEVVSFPVEFDLSRQDRWVKLKTRGILQRLGQGRKDQESAVTHHLRQYSAVSPMWYPLESVEGSTAANAVAGGYPALVSGVTTETTEATGERALPGVSGCILLGEDTSYFIGKAFAYQPTTAWTLLFFLQIDSAPASDILLLTINTTGTGRIIKLTLQTDSQMRVDIYQGDGITLLDSDHALFWNFSGIPTGSWVSAALYLFESGGTVTWALNFHLPSPPNASFYSINGSYSGSVGIFRQVTARSSSVHTAAGGLRLTQVMLYPGDFPFVTYTFADAAAAYASETNIERFSRLCADKGVLYSIVGDTNSGHEMGPQLPTKWLESVEECADVGAYNLEEDRDAFELVLRTRQSVYNGPVLELDIDQGHLSEPLRPEPDDQQTRNDVTVRRPGGGFARSIQYTGSLNINPPEEDPDGVGTYDESPEVNYYADTQLQAAADWRRSRGTQRVPRYPSLTLDLTGEAYDSDTALTARALAIDSGTLLTVTNQEVSPDSLPQAVQGYEEFIDQYDWDLTVTSAPGQIFTVGVSEYTTRVQPAASVTQAPFLVGTDTALKVRRLDTTKQLWVLTATDPLVADFDIMVAGVRLHVTSITGASDPQTINVNATPVNAVDTGFTIPPGQPVTLAEPWRVAW